MLRSLVKASHGIAFRRLVIGSDVIELDMNMITCFTSEEYIVSLNQGHFAKFCVAVSLVLVDLEFLVQQSSSLTL